MNLAYQIYLIALLLVCALAVVRQRSDLGELWRLFLEMEPMRRTAAVLLANAGLNAAFVTMSGIHDPWFWYIPLDGVAAALILIQPAGKPQSVIGGLYMAQIAMHGVYGALKLSGGGPYENGYWQVLIAVAFAQLAVLGGWIIGHHWRRLARRPGSGRRASVAEAESRKGVAP